MSQNTEQIYRTLLTLWAAFLMSQFMIAVVIFISKPELFKFDFSKPVISELAVLFAFTAIICFAMSFIFKAKYIKSAIDNRKPQEIQIALIISVAFCEAITIFGLILGFSNYPYFFVWIIFGIIGILLHFPKRQNLIDASYTNTIT